MTLQQKTEQNKKQGKCSDLRMTNLDHFNCKYSRKNSIIIENWLKVAFTDLDPPNIIGELMVIKHLFNENPLIHHLQEPIKHGG